MAIPDNNALKRGATGSISGFDGITLPDGTTLTEQNFSVSQLITYLRAFDAAYSPARIRALEKVVSSHVRDTDNPHKDTISMLTQELAKTLLRQYVPGTAPKDFPLVAVDAAFVDIGSVLVPMTFNRNSEINVINRQGYLQYVSENQPCIDWQTGVPLIPCWSEKTQFLPTISLSDATGYTPVNTRINSGALVGVVPVLMSSQVSMVETNTQNPFGLKALFQNLLTNGSEYTFSIFSFAQKQFGSYVLLLDSGEYVVFDIQSATITASSPSVNGYIYPLPNGWWRIGINFVFQSGGTGVQFLYSPKTYGPNLPAFTQADLIYVGTDKAAIATLYGPQLTDGPGVAPFTQIGTLAATTVQIPGFGSAVSTTSGMLVARYMNAAGLIANTDPIFAVDDILTLTEKSQASTMGTSRSVTYNVGVTNPDQSLTLTPNNPDGLFSTAISYSPQSIIALSDNTFRNTVSSQNKNFQPLESPTTITVGSFNGGLNALEFYAFPDDGQTLEFLVGDIQS